MLGLKWKWCFLVQQPLLKLRKKAVVLAVLVLMQLLFPLHVDL
jgi:hypothetical protein